MKKITKIFALVLAVVLMVTAFAACGGASNKVKCINVPLTDELYAFGVSKDDPDLLKSVNEFVAQIKEDGTLDAVINKYFGDGEKTPIISAAEDKNKDQLVVATNAAFAPFEYKDGEAYYGIDMELAKLLADKLGKELVIKNVEFEAVLQQVDAGYADMAMAGLTVNEARKEFVNFSESYYTASQVIIAKEDDTTFDECKTAADVEAILKTLDKSTVIGVQTGTTGEYYVKGDADWGFDGFNVTCTGYASGALAVQDMLNGNIKYVVIDQAPALYITDSYNAQA